MAAGCSSGVAFSKQNLLRLGIVLYGLRLTFQDIAHVGLSGVMIDACMLMSTFAIAYFFGVKVFKLDRAADRRRRHAGGHGGGAEAAQFRGKAEQFDAANLKIVEGAPCAGFHACVLCGNIFMME